MAVTGEPNLHIGRYELRSRDNGVSEVILEGNEDLNQN